MGGSLRCARFAVDFHGGLALAVGFRFCVLLSRLALLPPLLLLAVTLLRPDSQQALALRLQEVLAPAKTGAWVWTCVADGRTSMRALGLSPHPITQKARRSNRSERDIIGETFPLSGLYGPHWTCWIGEHASAPVLQCSVNFTRCRARLELVSPTGLGNRSSSSGGETRPATRRATKIHWTGRPCPPRRCRAFFILSSTFGT